MNESLFSYFQTIQVIENFQFQITVSSIQKNEDM